METDLRQLTDLLVASFLGYRGGAFIILADRPTLEIGQAIADSADALAVEIEKNIELINIDEWRAGQPLTELKPEFREELETKLSGPDEYHNSLLYIMQSLDGEIPMRLALAELAGAKGKIGGLPNCTIDVLEAGFNPENRPEFSQELYDFLSRITELKLTCNRGSNITAILDHNRYDIVNSNGVLNPGTYANPIPAEVFFHPADINGSLVISGSYGPLMGFKPFVGNYYALMEALDNAPIVWRIKDGKITDVSCDNTEIQTFVRKEVFEKDTEHGMKIGEFGLPANLYVLGREITGNLMIDEKGRVHIANGHGYQKRTRCEYDTDVHGDGLIACASLRAVNLDTLFMENNRYSPEVFKILR
jgi:hypothetical protein